VTHVGGSVVQVVTDEQIDSLVREAKETDVVTALPSRMRDKGAHREAQAEVTGENGSRFRVIARQSRLNPFDFSAILGAIPTGQTRVVRLRRYNGRSHEHTNKLEGTRLSGYHIHLATERYQKAGLEADGYAEAASGYTDLRTALECLARDCHFRPSDGSQLGLPLE